MKYRAYIQAIERKGKKGARVTLYQRIYYQGQQWQAALGISVPSEEYDKKSESVIGGAEAERYNRLIQGSLQIIRDLMLRYELIEHVTPTLEDVTRRWEEEMVNRGLKAGVRQEKRPERERLQDRIEDFINDQSMLKGWVEATGGRFRVIKKHLENSPIQLYFDDLTDTALMKFLQHRSEAGMANTSLQRMAGQLRWYLRWCAKNGYYKGNCHETFKPKLRGGDFSDKNIIHLTVEELRQMEAFEFTPNQGHLERVRDAFLFSCYTGLRYSDIKRLKPENIAAEGTNVLTKKDRSRLTIELNKHTKAIVEKYADFAKETGLLLPVPSNQKANKYLHELCELIGFDTPTAQVYNKGDKTEEVWLPKYELITFHSGRKTFITQALRLGIPVPVIMSFSGHETIKNLNRYMNIVDELKKKEMTKFDEI